MTIRRRSGTSASTAAPAPAKRRPIVMVSSTVYGIEDLLDRIHTLLVNRGYTVWMSHAGTIRVNSQNHAFADCLKAVEQCDLFLGLITTHYGSGQNPGDRTEPSITHQELLKAIELDKPRWFLAHSHVLFARSFLRAMGKKAATDRAAITLKKGEAAIDDVRIVDMYEAVTEADPDFAKRRGNWVQKFRDENDALTFVVSQFPPQPEPFDRDSAAEALIARVMTDVTTPSRSTP